jgi:RNA polymerase sigma factor (sigma-70 family)
LLEKDVHITQSFLASIETHKGILYKICRLYQENEEDRQDLFQEIILQLWKARDSFRGDSQFSSWMYRVALNTAIVYLRKQRRYGQHVVQTPYPERSEEVEPPHDSQEKLVIFQKAIHELSKAEKAVIFLYMEGHSGKDMADILGLSPGNVRVRINRVKDKLQSIIKNMGYEL